MYNHPTVQCKGELMTPHGLIELLYKTDNIFGEGSVCPKLRDMHINPTSFQKINVSLAMQRFFGIIRSAGGGQNKPTALSFLQLFRMLSLYYPTKTVLRGCNVDGQEKMEMLTSYTDWLIKRFKDNRKMNKTFKNYIKDILLTNIKQPAKAQIFTYFATLPHLVAEKGTNPSPEADIIIASKICPTSSSSIPPSWLRLKFINRNLICEKTAKFIFIFILSFHCYMFWAVMGFQYCCAPGCKKSSRDKSVRFFYVPCIRKNLGKEELEIGKKTKSSLVKKTESS
ncbi:hypothetical protein OUZ56_010478 [Daphnia magna]|uniref:Transposable element P transposase-like RNase H C-terminal domain-containing protein n=1 Tax=Daphnia magna TaxID=35525 RepID=A0ABR0AIS1_9CRUS|nr:hypothetical protein OUZ56_010478 [Daphnia magna]